MQNTTAKIYLNHIRQNAEVFVNLTKKPLCAVVKANAYGHGAVQVVNVLESVADMFAVSLLEEALDIETAACGKDVLVFTPPFCEEDVLLAAWHGFVLTVSDYATARLVCNTAERYRFPVRVHIKANTGMNRYGMNVQTLGKACKLLKANAYVRVEGLYSHLYGNTKAQAEAQRQAFLRAQKVAKGYFPNLLCHLSATYGTLLGEEFVFDMTRIGIGLYGYLPSGEKDIVPSLKKGMAVYATVAATRRYQSGGAGYGQSLTVTPKDGSLAVLRFGYADGFLREKKENAYAGARVCNNLCMDACICEGNYKKGKCVPIMTDAEKTALVTNTIAYEVLCAATRRAEFVYVWE